MMSDEEILSRIFRALADATRRRMIEELARRGRQSLFEICARMVSEHGIAQSRQGFSRHLAVLEEAGILHVEWQGTTKLHSLNKQVLARLSAGWLSQFREADE